MINYSHLVYKQMKVDKRISFCTIFGIMITIILFITSSELYLFMKDVNINRAKHEYGNYEAQFLNLSEEQYKYLKGNVEIENLSFAAVDENLKIRVKSEDVVVNMNALDENAMEIVFSTRFGKIDGRLPKNKDEIMIDRLSIELLGKKNGDTLKLGNSNYKIVGIYEKDFYNNQIDVITYFDENNNYEHKLAYINVKDSKDKVNTIINIANNIGVNTNEEYIFHTPVLMAYGYDSMLNQISFDMIYIGILVVMSILIYSSISIVLKDRLRYLDILRHIGATPYKIRVLILKESFIISSLSILPALILGHFLTWLIINVGLSKLIEMNFYGVSFGMYWNSVLTIIIITAMTIFISACTSTLKLKNNEFAKVIKVRESYSKSDKVRKSNIIRKIFGYKGELAYKNIRANNKSFIITTITLIVSLVFFVMFTGYFWISIKGIKEDRIIGEKNFEISINHRIYEKEWGKDEDVNHVAESDEIRAKEVEDYIDSLDESINIIKSTNNAKDIFSYLYLRLSEFEEKYLNIEETKATDSYVSFPVMEVKLYIYSEESLKEILPYINSENISLDDFDESGIVLMKTPETIRKNSKELNYILEDINSTLGIEIIGDIESKYIPFGDRISNINGVFMIASEKFYENKKKEIFKKMGEYYSQAEIYFNFKDLSKREETIKSINSNLAKYGAIYVDNYINSIDSIRILVGTSIIFYTIMFLIMLIVIVNIINNKLMSISLRKKELYTFLAIGMDRRDLKKMIVLEGVVQWFISSLIGGIISIIGLNILNIILIFSGESNKSRVPIGILLLGIIMLLILEIAGSVVSLKQFKEYDKSELVRND